MTNRPDVHIEIGGQPATGLDPAVVPLLQGAYGHYTAMQVRDGRTRGLPLHLERLDHATRELFGTDLDGDRVRALVRHALGGSGRSDAAVRVYVYGAAAGGGAPTVVVTVREPRTMPPRPRSMMPVPFLRPVPHIKHAGGVGQAYYGRAAALAGFDDALLTGPGGEIAEGHAANVAFWNGTSLVWPEAPALRGITMALLERLLPSVRREVRLADLGGYPAAALVNSQGVAPVHRIGTTEFAVDEELMRRLAEAYAAVPWDRI
ncbi:aminotransferase class IV [Streptomyces sp. I6]|uniref:aminotransferase class IV n=1 Tax=Streptomyces sp. I6 TaxID=2483113 RepID=UPI000F44E056|nr:aminotransferase class IV [Streptomyces sp. I6]RNL71040.1 class IV aminotransferase [Streptomyces sp. I6]